MKIQSPYSCAAIYAALIALFLGLAVKAATYEPTGNCPSTVKVGTILQPSELGVNGWFAYTYGGKVYVSGLKSFAPKEIGGFTRAVDLEIWGDGKWILVETQTATGNIDPRTKGRKVFLVKPDGSSKTDLGITCDMSSHMKGTTDGNSIAYAKKSDVYEQKIAFAGDKPSKSGDPKKVAQGIPHGSGRDWDAAANWVFARANYTSGGMAGYAYKIPPNGMASTSTKLGPSCKNQCGQAVSQSNVFIAFNQGCGRSVGCLAEDHKGVAIIDTRKPVKNNMVDWNLQSGVFIWCPETYAEDGKNYDLRAGAWNQSEFHHYKFTNNDDYIIATHQRAMPLNIWLINWKTAKWTPLMKSQKDVGGNWSGGGPKNGDAFLGGSVSSSIRPEQKNAPYQYVNRMHYLQTWHDVLGRKMPARIHANAVRVSAETKKVEIGSSASKAR